MKMSTLFFALILSLTVLFAQSIPDHDRRNTVIRHTDTHYQFGSYDTLADWKERARYLRRQVQFSAGLMPWPEKTDLNAEIFGRIEYEDYSIEKVILETYPGFFLGGNLFRPIGQDGPFPAVVSPHGHWRYGRLENTKTSSIIKRCITLARQGYVVLSYDTVGLNDTVPHIAHRQDWGRRADLWGVGILGTQLWNSIRATDFLTALSDVDSNRIAATGASGGGSQVFLQTAVDDRIRFSAPVNMISAHMQGGDWCENAPNLRIGTNNMEIAALTAPRPMLMISATGDWTKNTPTEEFPAIQKIYNLYGAEDGIEEVQFDSPHNYHQDSREAMYRFFGRKVLNNEVDESNGGKKRLPIRSWFRLPSGPSSLLSYWGREAPKTPKDLDTFISSRIVESEKYLTTLKPTNHASLQKVQPLFHEWLSRATMTDLPTAEALGSENTDKWQNGEALIIGRTNKGDRVPAVLLHPQHVRDSVDPVLIIHSEGTKWILNTSEDQNSFVNGFLKRGGVVAGVDVFQVGRAREERNESEITGSPRGEHRRRYLTTFNRTDTANRIQDVLTAIAYFKSRLEVETINLFCPGEAGIWCFFARALADGGIRLIADLGVLTQYDDAEIARKMFIPHIRRAGDFRGAALLQAPEKTVLYNVATLFPSDWLETAFELTESRRNLSLHPNEIDEEQLLEILTPIHHAEH
tara:strand:+ start:19040 stop:21115 length:2076 start_codon:yes stop_codon:yes gene_type:complete